MIKRFLNLYQPDAPKWDNIADLAQAFEWTQLINSTTADFLVAQGVSEKYVTEVVEAATRVNYGQVWFRAKNRFSYLLISFFN